MWHNTQSKEPTSTIAFADANQKFYPFLYLNGRITALSLMGIVSASKLEAKNKSSTKSTEPEDANSCQICCDNPANLVMIPCGHTFFCSDCQNKCEATRGKKCPVCQNTYDSVIEIASD